MNEPKFRHPIFALMAVSLFSIAPGFLSARSAENPPIALTFIANEGVLVETPSHKILFDALYDKPHENYPAPTPGVMEKMESGLPPFDGIELVLVTHNHPDHVGAVPLLRFLHGNPNAKLVAPGDLLASLDADILGPLRSAGRVIAIDTPVNTSKTVVVNGMTVRAFRTRHSGDRLEPWNIMYLVTADGRTVFHEGDSDGKPETFTDLGLENTPVDLALVHFWFPLDENGSRLIREWLKPGHIGLFHLPLRLYEDAPLKVAAVARNYPGIFLLKTEMEKRTFRFPPV